MTPSPVTNLWGSSTWPMIWDLVWFGIWWEPQRLRSQMHRTAIWRIRICLVVYVYFHLYFRICICVHGIWLFMSVALTQWMQIKAWCGWYYIGLHPTIHFDAGDISSDYIQQFIPEQWKFCLNSIWFCLNFEKIKPHSFPQEVGQIN